MSRSAREAHEEGECGYWCVYCMREEDRERAMQEAADDDEEGEP